MNNKILVGVMTYNNFGYLQKTVPHNYKLAGMDADWVILDDGSDAENLQLLDSWEWPENNKVKVICNEDNKGISGVHNQLFDLAIAGGYEYIVCMDNDIMCTFNWLHILVDSCNYVENLGVGSPLIYNDTTMLQKMDGITTLDGAKQVDGMGAACTIIPDYIFKNYRYRTTRSFMYEDADFHGLVKHGGFTLNVFPMAQALHLPWVVWLDPEYEKKKLLVRHKGRKCSMDAFPESFKRSYNRVLNKYIKDGDND